MNVREQLEILGEVAEGQWGMFTSAQARQRGISRLQIQRATESGNLERIAHGVYRIAGAPTDAFESLRTAWLAIEPTRVAEERLNDLQPGAVVCGAAAAWLHGLGDLDPVPYDIATAVRTRPRRDDVRTATRQLQNGEVEVRHGLPVTTVERTVADLILDDVDDGHLSTITAEARKLDLQKVEAYIEAAPVRRRAKARVKFRQISIARATSLLGDLQTMSPEMREQILLAIRPALERVGKAFNAEVAKAVKPSRERLAETLEPVFKQLAKSMTSAAVQATARSNRSASRQPQVEPVDQDRLDADQ